MKKLLLIVTVVLLMTGCSLQTFETVEDMNDMPAIAKPATLLLDLPEEAAKPAMEGASGTLYFCDDYEIMVEIMPAGDLNKTIQTLTGFHKGELNLMQTKRGVSDCYEGAWSAAGEAGDQVGRILVLDDTRFHYCISIMAAAEDAGYCTEAWNAIMDSAALADS